MVTRTRSGLMRLVLIALFLASAFSALRFTGCAVLDQAENRALDLRFRWRGEVLAGEDVVIVAVDDRSIEEIGRWPWPRAVQAKLIDRIAEGGPAVIGLDIVHSEASGGLTDSQLRSITKGLSERGRQNVLHALVNNRDDALFAESLKKAGNVVLGYFVDFSNTVGAIDPGEVATYAAVRLAKDVRAGALPGGVRHAERAVVNIPEIRSAAREQAYFNIVPDADDGGVRRMPMVIEVGGQMALPLPVAMYEEYVLARKRSGASVASSVSIEPFGVREARVGDLPIPLSEDGQMLLNYRGRGRTFLHHSAAAVLSGQVRSDVFQDRLVIVGISAVAVGDLRVTPFDGVFPGVEVLATALDNMLRKDFVRCPQWLVVVEIATMLLAAIGLAALLYFAPGWVGGFGAAIMTVAYLGVTQYLFERRGLVLAMVHPLLTMVSVYAVGNIESYLREERERRKLRHALELYLSPSMAALLSQHPERLRLGGEKRHMTVLFSDIRGFTNLSEGTEPEQLVEFLNAYLGEMTDAVFATEGMLDKYVGDAVMAVWGAPLEQPDHARRAVGCARDMLARLERLNREWQSRGWPELRIGIGINSGDMVFGNMGSAQHLSLTVIGDEVNTASRFEGLTKEYGVDIIVGKATVAALGGWSEEPATRELDLVRVKGKEEPLPIFEVAARCEDASRSFDAFEAGLAAYRLRQWAAARHRFREAVERNTGDSAAALFLERCERMESEDPGPLWDGVTTMTSK